MTNTTLAAFWGLMASGFTSSTLLPGTSGPAFLLFLHSYPNYTVLALICLTIANTLGSLTSFAIAYLFPKKNFSEKTEKLVKKYGAPLMLFSSLPIVGDALPLAAGWLKISIYKTVFFLALGKFLRYYALMLIFFWATK